MLVNKQYNFKYTVSTYLCGQPWQIFWSAKEPPKTLLSIAGCPKAFKASSKLSTNELKNSKASCCSRRLTGSPQSLRNEQKKNTMFSQEKKPYNNKWEYINWDPHPPQLHEEVEKSKRSLCIACSVRESLIMQVALQRGRVTMSHHETVGVLEGYYRSSTGTALGNLVHTCIFNLDEDTIWWTSLVCRCYNHSLSHVA